MAMMQYESNLARVSSQNNLINYNSEITNSQETIEGTMESTQQHMEEEKDDYYALLIRSNGVIYNIIIIILYCFIIPKWFKTQKQAVQDDSKYDFYKD